MKVILKVVVTHAEEPPSEIEVNTDSEGECWYDCPNCGERHQVKVVPLGRP
jgi:hypothetical protein